MSLYSNACASFPLAFSNDCCYSPINGRIRGALIYNVNSAFTDRTDLAEWTTKINNQDVFILPSYVRGSKAVPETTTADGFGNQATINTGKSHTATITLGFSCDNAQAVDRLTKSQGFGLVLLLSDGSTLWSNTAVTFAGGENLPEGINDQMTFDITGTWSSQNNMECVQGVPTSIFACNPN